MSRRKFPSSIKCLLHFDYPYFNEPNDGLGDEIGLETWTKNGINVSLYGTEIPNAGTLAPKFGYRCLFTSNGSIHCNNESGIWNLKSNGRYEIEFFSQFKEKGRTKNIFSLMNTGQSSEILKLFLDGGNFLNLEASGFGADSILGDTEIVTNTWHHILMRILDNRMCLYLDGNLEISTSITPDLTLSVGQVIIGNNISSSSVYIDEFVFRHSAGRSKPVIPTEPYNGYLDEKSIGGYGTGADGDKIVTENITLNTCGTIREINNGTNITVSDITEGDCLFSSGSEVFIHVTTLLSGDIAEYPYMGLYEFRKITSIADTEDGISITLNESINTENGDTFTLDDTLLETYKVQVISVPNYNTLTINSEATVEPSTYSGIVVFRCKGDCTIHGKILTSGYGFIRFDLIQMTHSKMIDRFMITKGGGIYIVCGGTLRLDENSRLGASWSGLGENYNGAAGYGGSGLFYTSVMRGGVGGGAGGRGGRYDNTVINTTANNVALGGAVGSTGASKEYFGGGGGGCGGNGGNTTYGFSSSRYKIVAGAGGGCQGKKDGHGGICKGCNKDAAINGASSFGCNGGYRNTGSTMSYPTISGAGGGGAGGNGGNGGTAGSCIVIVSKKASIPEASISTGGECGTYLPPNYRWNFDSKGAGGTGFCYMAVGEFLDE